ncbi:hypothetical protein GQ457_03G006280 [Hibiscus cannabinus]
MGRPFVGVYGECFGQCPSRPLVAHGIGPVVAELPPDVIQGPPSWVGRTEQKHWHCNIKEKARRTMESVANVRCDSLGKPSCFIQGCPSQGMQNDVIDRTEPRVCTGMQLEVYGSISSLNHG